MKAKARAKREQASNFPAGDAAATTNNNNNKKKNKNKVQKSRVAENGNWAGREKPLSKKMLRKLTGMSTTAAKGSEEAEMMMMQQANQVPSDIGQVHDAFMNSMASLMATQWESFARGMAMAGQGPPPLMGQAGGLDQSGTSMFSVPPFQMGYMQQTQTPFWSNNPYGMLPVDQSYGLQWEDNGQGQYPMGQASDGISTDPDPEYASEDYSPGPAYTEEVEGEVEEGEDLEEGEVVPAVPKQKKPVFTPKPTEQYLAQAFSQPRRLPSRQPLLIILDLNGTLGHRGKGGFKKRAKAKFFLRSILQQEELYKVMVWTSAKPPMMDKIRRHIFTRAQWDSLVARWGKAALHLPRAQYGEKDQKVQAYKDLCKVWNDPAIQAKYPQDKGNGKARWDQSNTVLIDYNPVNAAGQPLNLLQVPYYTGSGEMRDVFYELTMKLDILASFDDVSKVVRQWTYYPSGGDDVPSVPMLTHEQTKLHREEAEKNARQLKKEIQRAEQRAVNEEKKRQLAINEERNKHAARMQALVDAERFETQLLSEISDRSRGGGSGGSGGDGGATTESNEHLQLAADGSSGNENYLLDRLEEALGLKNL